MTSLLSRVSHEKPHIKPLGRMGMWVATVTGNCGIGGSPERAYRNLVSEMRKAGRVLVKPRHRVRRAV